MRFFWQIVSALKADKNDYLLFFTGTVYTIDSDGSEADGLPDGSEYPAEGLCMAVRRSSNEQRGL